MGLTAATWTDPMASHLRQPQRVESRAPSIRLHHRHISAATDGVELRVLDGVTPTRREVIKALKAFERFFENQQQAAASI
jgi:hypothetical protein